MSRTRLESLREEADLLERLALFTERESAALETAEPEADGPLRSTLLARLGAITREPFPLDAGTASAEERALSAQITRKRRDLCECTARLAERWRMRRSEAERGLIEIREARRYLRGVTEDPCAALDLKR